MQALSDMLKTNAILKELDMSSNDMNSADAKMLSEGIAANGALTSLDISYNYLGVRSLPEGWSYDDEDECFKHVGGRTAENWPEGSKPEGFVALADAIKNNGALTSLYLRNNHIEPEGALALADAIEKNGARVVKVKGLKNARNLNGLAGIVQETLANARRVVQLDNGERKSFKPENLETLDTRGALRVLDISHNNNIGEAMWKIMRACRPNNVKLIAEGITLPKAS